MLLGKLPGANLNESGRWLLGIAFAKSNTKYTHENGLKRVAYRLRRCKAEARKNLPRGDSRYLGDPHSGEIVQCTTNGYLLLLQRKPWGTNLALPLFAKTGSMTRRLGSTPKVPESGNNHLKSWNRHRYGHLIWDSYEMEGGMFCINASNEIASVTESLALPNSCVVRNYLLAHRFGFKLKLLA
jgi:hypothetical protein